MVFDRISHGVPPSERILKVKTIEDLIRTYPQLTLGVREGLSETAEYADIVKRGKMPEQLTLPIPLSGEEKSEMMETPAGSVLAVYLPERSVFEYFVRVLAYRCEPKEIPPSMGAVCIRGLNNWRKIKAHKEAYLATGNQDWKEEFRRFTAVKGNCRDAILLISKGGYSNLAASEVFLSKEEWVAKSRILRTFHELSHVISGESFPENKEALRDEVVADAIGILAAFGRYDTGIARKALGIEGKTYRKGGRLENYVEAEKLEEEMQRAYRLTELLETFLEQNPGLPPFEALKKLEEQKLGIGGMGL